jgi:coenzyme F420 biosynthesis associated uncharacterized protein
VTHRTQFAAAPWLHKHVQDLLGEFLLASDLETGALLDRLRNAVSGITGSARGAESKTGGRSLVEMIQTPEQRAILDRITGLMSLLEGHADVVMDRVGPAVVPSVETIRSRFDTRRREAGPLSKFFRRVIGLEMKMKQYAEGAEFVRQVIGEIGMDGLNVVWTGPDRLPTGEEIRDPKRWLERIAAAPAVSA